MSEYSFTQVKLPPKSEYKCSTIFADDLLRQRDELLAAVKAVLFAGSPSEEDKALSELEIIYNKIEATK